MNDAWIRKIRTYFRNYDFDKDGVIHRSDFLRISERIGGLEKFDPAQIEIARNRCDDVSYLTTYVFFPSWTRAYGNHDRRPRQ